MECIGKDFEGATDISLEALNALYLQGKEVLRVEIEATESGWTFIMRFVFKDDTYYEASGFNIGYGGTGPHGLYKAIRIWYPDKLPEDFYATKISRLKHKPGYKIVWTPVVDFEYEEL